MISNEEAQAIADGLIAYYEQLAREWLTTVSEEELRSQLQRIAAKMDEACHAIGTALLHIHQPGTHSVAEQVTLSTLCDTLDILRDTVRAIRDPNTGRDQLAELLGWAGAAMEVCMQIIDEYEGPSPSGNDLIYN